MFCPSCGKDNVPECKFCASCGTNLEVVTRALYTNSVGIYTRFDSALNQLIAHYSERVFKKAPTTALSRRLSDSWKVLGQGILTTPVDFILFWLMLFAVFPVRLLTLIFSTPFILLMQRSNRPKALPPENEKKEISSNSETVPREWTEGSVVSVMEHTTEHLPDYLPQRRSRDSATK